MDFLFVNFYTTEFALKVMAYGFYFHKNAYLKDNWNKLDFIIVCTSLVSFFSSLNALFFLKVFRFLRPLKSIQRVKSLKIMMSIIFNTFFYIKDVLFVFMFSFSVNAIIS